MANPFYIKDSTENRISYYHLLLFLISLPFDRIYSELILISLSVHTAIWFRRRYLKNMTPKTIILQSVFFVTLISLFYAVSFRDGLNTLTKQLAIVLFPLIFNFTALPLGKYRDRLIQGLTWSCSITIIYLYVDAIRTIRYHGLSMTSLFSWSFVNHNFSLPIDAHATYLSMLLVISIVYCLQRIFSGQDEKKLLYIIHIAILLAGLIQLSSKSALIASAIIILIGFPWLFLKKEQRPRFLFLSISCFAIISTIILAVNAFRQRYIVTLEDDLYENSGFVKINGRADRWYTAIDLIRKSPLFGSGSGSEIPLLKNIYFERKMYGSYLAELNAHNQYLSFLINSGVFGLSVCLFTLAWGLRRSIQQRDIMLFSFIILIAVISLSEDLLDVNKGIFFYGFFFPLLIFSGKDEPA